MSATVYGGSDWPLGVASGLASNPTFFNLRKGKAVLESVRMIPDFFSEGPFRSAGLKVEAQRYSLQQQLAVPYYQPLPKHLRNPQGDYPLTPAGESILEQDGISRSVRRAISKGWTRKSPSSKRAALSSLRSM